MTVLLAAAFRDRAMIAADGLQTVIDAGGATQVVEKTQAISDQVVATKFGYSGPQTESLWVGLHAMPESDRRSVGTVLDEACRLGRPIYEERKSFFAAHGEGDYGLTVLFASFDDTSGPGIHWIDFKMGAGVPESLYYRDTSATRWVAQGPDGVNVVASETLYAVGCKATSSGLVIDGAAWTRAFIMSARSISPQKLGFPASLRSVGSSGSEHYIIGERPPIPSVLFAA